ncbi:MAG: LysM peptidoglycan-binding domain-containing protein, partial [Parasphingorhabdus sp.]
MAFGLVLAPSEASAQKKSNADQVPYVFERGDTLIDFADKYLRKRSDYFAVQRINHIADPRKISIGKRLRIPVKLLKYRPSEASLSAFRGAVAIS